MNSFSLYQTSGDAGDFYMNSGPDAAALIDAGRELSEQYPGTDYAVKRGNDTIWSSKDTGSRALFRLVRKEDNISILLFPGTELDLLIKMGKQAAAKNPGWILEVQDSELNVIWTNQKSAPGKAEDTLQNG